MINYDWNEIAFKDKSDLKQQQYIFIAGFREISTKRLIQIVKEYLPKGNVLMGILKEDFISGFEGQPHFRTMSKNKITKFIEKLEESKLPNKVDTLEYLQRDLPVIIEKINPGRIVLVNGSWIRMFHLRPEYYTLANNRIRYNLVSPFVDEKEALEYLKTVKRDVDQQVSYNTSIKYSDEEIFAILAQEAKRSFATDFQIACALVKNGRIHIIEHNEVVPFETYAMHYGSIKEKNFSPPNDLNHYDTSHAEMMTLLKSIENKIDLRGSSLYINVMPCPTCARVLCKSGIQEVVYSLDHSDGYANNLFEKVGIKTRRVII